MTKSDQETYLWGLRVKLPNRNASDAFLFGTFASWILLIVLFATAPELNNGTQKGGGVILSRGSEFLAHYADSDTDAAHSQGFGECGFYDFTSAAIDTTGEGIGPAQMFQELSVTVSVRPFSLQPDLDDDTRSRMLAFATNKLATDPVAELNPRIAKILARGKYKESIVWWPGIAYNLMFAGVFLIALWCSWKALLPIKSLLSRQRLASGHCPKCNYQIESQFDVCPECGTELDDECRESDSEP